MPREKEGYRDNLELLNARFPDHDMLTPEEVMIVTGIRSRDTFRKYFVPNKQGRIDKPALARFMCSEIRRC